MECIICYEEKELIMSPCFHYACKDCWRTWSTSSSNCHVCRHLLSNWFSEQFGDSTTRTFHNVTVIRSNRRRNIKLVKLGIELTLIIVIFILLVFQNHYKNKLQTIKCYNDYTNNIAKFCQKCNKVVEVNEKKCKTVGKYCSYNSDSQTCDCDSSSVKLKNCSKQELKNITDIKSTLDILDILYMLSFITLLISIHITVN